MFKRLFFVCLLALSCAAVSRAQVADTLSYDPVQAADTVMVAVEEPEDMPAVADTVAAPEPKPREEKEKTVPVVTSIMSAPSQPTVVSSPSEINEAMHMHFKGVPIDGKLGAFCNQLTRLGLSYIGSKDAIGVMQGRFAGIDDVRILVYTSSGLVWKVTAVFPGMDTWQAMKNQYIIFKRSLTQKYYCTPQSTEYFPAYCPEGTGREHNAFKDETAVFRSVYTVNNGTIMLYVRAVPAGGKGRMCLCLDYEDGLNKILKDNAFLEDL